MAFGDWSLAGKQYAGGNVIPAGTLAKGIAFDFLWNRDYGKPYHQQLPREEGQTEKKSRDQWMSSGKIFDDGLIVG